MAYLLYYHSMDTTGESRGKFIVFDGTNGSGVSTQSRLFHEYLQKRGSPAILTSEPTKEGPVAARIREILLDERSVTPRYLQKLFAENRREHVNRVIAPSLKQGLTVVCDRYYFSAVAFGSIDLDPEWLIEINKQFVHPDCPFILSVQPETCMERIHSSGEAREIFEKLGKLRKAWAMYKTLPPRFRD